MKTILVPTDFSQTANNALTYATELALKLPAKLLLLNVFRIPVYELDTPSEVANKEEHFRNYATSKLQQTMDGIHLNHPELPVESIVLNGFIGDEITAMACVHSVEMIVMGTTGASGLEEIVMGSTTREVIEKAPCPVLAIPRQAHWHGIHHVVAAVDNQNADPNTMVEVVHLAELFQAQITLVHLMEEAEDEKELVDDFHLCRLRRDVGRQTHYSQREGRLLEGDDLLRTLDTFLRQTQAELLMMITSQRTLFKQLFSLSSPQQMACHTHVPLLVFHTYHAPRTLI